MYRLDSVGFRVGTVATIATTNTVPFEVDNVLKVYANSSIRIGASTINGNNPGTTNVAIGNTSLFSVGVSATNNVGIGAGAGAFIASSTSSVCIGANAGYYTRGSNNICLGTDVNAIASSSTTAATQKLGIGRQANYRLQTGTDNVAIGGFSALWQNLVGSGNVAIGSGSSENVLGSKNITLGFQAGSYETGSNSLYIHNGLGQTTEANGKTRSIIYGQMNATLSSQLLTVNGGFRVQTSETSTDTAIRIDTVGLIKNAVVVLNPSSLV